MNVVVFGGTGMVGEGVLLESLRSEAVSRVVSVTRRPTGHTHAKLTEVIVGDMFDLAKHAESLKNLDACFFCLGISSIGMSEADYTRTTYHLTMKVADVLLEANKGMTFCYVSGQSTDSTEKGSMMWARVKGRTENELLQRPFKASYMFRPGFIRPVPGQKYAFRFARVLGTVYPLLRALFPNSVCTLRDIAAAMINASLAGYPFRVLENKDIAALAATHPSQIPRS